MIKIFIYLGNRYSISEGVEQNYTKAVEYYERAANLGNSDALYNLGVCYYKGYGVEQNYTKAIKYYERAANLGNFDARLALHNLIDENL